MPMKPIGKLAGKAKATKVGWERWQQPQYSVTTYEQTGSPVSVSSWSDEGDGLETDQEIKMAFGDESTRGQLHK